MKNPIRLTPIPLQPLRAARPRQLTWLSFLAAADLSLSGVLVHVQGLSVGAILGLCYTLFLGGSLLLGLFWGSRWARLGFSLFYGVAGGLSAYLLATLPWSPFFAGYEGLNLLLSWCLVGIAWLPEVSSWLNKSQKHIQALVGEGRRDLAIAKMELGFGLAAASLMTANMLVLSSKAELRLSLGTALPLFVAGLVFAALQAQRLLGSTAGKTPVPASKAPVRGKKAKHVER